MFKQIYPVLWHLISEDIALLWQIAPAFQNHPCNSCLAIAEPLTVNIYFN